MAHAPLLLPLLLLLLLVERVLQLQSGGVRRWHCWYCWQWALPLQHPLQRRKKRQRPP